MQIAVIGTGYVGLVSGTCFAQFGHTVVCVDKDPGKVEMLRGGRMPIYEPGLDQLVARNVTAGRLAFTTSTAEAVAEADAVFIAVGTPSRKSDGNADLSYVYAAAREVAEAIGRSRAGKPTVVVTKSTVPVGTGDEVERILREVAPNASAWVVSNPEFLREGAAIEDFSKPDRVIVGANETEPVEVMRAIYAPVADAGYPVIFTDRRTSELTKYAANAFLSIKITFINEMADLCEAAQANVVDLARGIGLDQRIGSRFLNPGPGYGGSCFPKDTLALLKTAEDFQSPVRVVDVVVQVNEARKRAMGRRVLKTLGSAPRGKRVAVLGLTFKPETDDMREAPSIAIVQMLEDNGVEVIAHDPEGMPQARQIMPGVAFADGAEQAIAGADAVVIVTEWQQYRDLDLVAMRDAMRGDVLVDLRNVFEREQAERVGLRYHCIGR